ncbi:MAG: hypothetical protein VST67_07380 [Nitrospirota bacterium]|nr:hypothetical protein [Nitrospirota bacterium]
MGPLGRFSAIRNTVLLSLSALVFLSFGCKVSLNPKVDPLPMIKPIPLDVGVYFSPEFRSYEYRYEGYKISGEPGDKESFAIGEASVDLFNQLFQGMFKSTVEVQQRPTLSSSGMKLAGVIEPNIEEFKLTKSQEQPGRRRRYRVQLTYRFTVYAPDGKISVFWVSGRGRSTDRRFATTGKIYGEATDEAMKDAGKRFATRFLKIPEIQQWLESIGYSNHR